MMWDGLFGAANLLALIMWVVLILAPRRPLSEAVVMYGGAGLLCAAYAVLITLVVSGLVDPVPLPGAGGGGFMSVPHVRALFMSDGGVTIGWIHYLAFDLFVGLWIAKDADAKGFSRLLQAPILVLTFVAGPFGLFLWLIIRERRARYAPGAIRSELRR